MPLLKSPYLHGLHEGHEQDGLRHYQDKPSWIVFTEGIGYDPNDKSGGDYRHWTQQGFWPIVRLNNAYEPGGTIPHKDYFEKFAQRCQNFVAASQGDVHYWIIGNEPNGTWERPHGWPISPEDYVQCYLLCREAIKKVKPGVVVMPAPVAVWNVDTGDWLAYFKRLMELVEGNCDGIALHTYSHGSDPSLIISEAKMDAPYQDRNYHFRAYQDFMKVIPQSMRSLPVLITESDQDEPWLDQPNTWIQEAYREINSWNQNSGNQTIQALVMYRWPNKDKWYMVGKQHVTEDFRAAVRTGYMSPEPRIFKSIDTPSAVPTGKGKVIATLLNIRDQPNISGNYMGAVKADDIVEIFEEKNGWYRIGLNRWVSAEWIKRIDSAPQSSEDCWSRILPFILKWEGGWAEHPADPGGATMKGITIGTYINWHIQRNLPLVDQRGQIRTISKDEFNKLSSEAISNLRFNNKERLRNIPDPLVAQIYYESYYLASGADKLPWPMCLAHTDLAVNGGVGRAKEALDAVGLDFWDYMVWRRDWYRRLEQFPVFGRAWINRCKDLIMVAYE